MIVILLTCHMSLNRWSISQISFHLSISTHPQKPKLSPSFLVINQTTILFLTFKKYYYYAMEALNAAALVLKPISVLKPEPKKHSSFPSIPHLKPQFNGTSLVLISSVFSSAFAKALTYEEALNQSTTASDSSFAAPDLDVIDGIVNFGVENPLVVAGGAALLAVPAILSQVFGKSSSKAWGVETAKIAYQKLGDDGDAQLLDIRAASDIRSVGSPNIKELKKKPVTVAYNGDDKQGFLKKLSLRFKDPENTTLFILDKFDGSSELVAELVTVNGFKAAYAIKDGAEGPRGWMVCLLTLLCPFPPSYLFFLTLSWLYIFVQNSSLPWILPKKSFSFDLSSLNDAVDGILGDGNEAVTLLFGIAAAAGLSLFAFTEVETILEVLGSAALVQLVSKKLLYAEDRRRTLKEFGDFVSAKIGPKEILDDVKDIGKALLPPLTFNALPAPTKAPEEAVVEPTNSAPPPPPAAEVKAEAETVAAVATPVEAPPEVKTVPKIEVKEEALPKPSRPLSPYPYVSCLKTNKYHI
ncbi:putative Rhodanese-like domain-containing protein STR4 [Helianthus annuus]|nr:putative Rhodanese-like domain-containing protein STR4 [Helianthus annuus]